MVDSTLKCEGHGIQKLIFIFHDKVLYTCEVNDECDAYINHENVMTLEIGSKTTMSFMLTLMLIFLSFGTSIHVNDNIYAI